MSTNPGTVAATNPHAEISVPPGADFPDDSQPDGYRIVYGSRREVCGAIGGAPACILWGRSAWLLPQSGGLVRLGGIRRWSHRPIFIAGTNDGGTREQRTSR